MLAAFVLALAALGGSLDVRWDAPAPGCESQAAVRARVAERLASRVDDHATIEVDGQITDHGPDLQLALIVSVDAVTTERTLVAPSCDELVDAVVLITSLAVGAEPSFEPAEAEPEEPQPPAPAKAEDGSAAAEYGSTTTEEDSARAEDSTATGEERPHDEPPLDEPPPSPPRRLGALIRAGIGVAGGRRPGAGLAVSGGTALHGRLWLARLDLAYGPSRRAFVDGFSDRGVEVRSVIVSVAGGVRWRLTDRLHLPVTGGIELGTLVAEGFGVSAIARRAQPWVAPMASVGLDIRLTPWLALWSELDASVALVQPAFAIEGRGTVFEAQFGALAGWAGFMIMLGDGSR